MTVVVDAGADVDQLLRPSRVPGELVLARPLDAYRLLDRPGDQHGVRSGVVTAVRPVRSRSSLKTTRTFSGLRPKVRASDARSRSVPVRGTRPSPSHRPSHRPPHRTPRARRDSDWARSNSRKRPRRFRDRRRCVAFADERLIAIDGSVANHGRKPLVTGQPLPFAPRDLQGLGGTQRRPLVCGDDGEEIVDAHHANIGNRGDRGKRKHETPETTEHTDTEPCRYSVREPRQCSLRILC